ncbi:hypothetical protein BD779DRAFT_457854 [Infundibulicybe gibba]|nr:hypothetical protein BD779DRAFT_457854 [Infundibulicybe gibba]
MTFPQGRPAPLQRKYNPHPQPLPIPVPLDINPQHVNHPESPNSVENPAALPPDPGTSKPTSSSLKATRKKTALLVTSLANELFFPTRSRLSAQTSFPGHSTDMGGMAKHEKATTSNGPGNTSNIRVLGRGGQGSKPRRIQSPSAVDRVSPPAPISPTSPKRPQSPLSSEIKRQDVKPIIRVVGRGGSGSKPRGVEPPSIAELHSISKARSLDEPRTIRVSGRGGAGSRPRLLQSDASWSKKTQSKSRHSRSQFTLHSTDTLSTLSIRSSPSQYRASTYQSLPVLVQRTSSSQTSSSDDVGIIPVSTRDRISPIPEPDEYYRAQPPITSRRSLSKLARTLGERVPGRSFVRKKNPYPSHDSSSCVPRSTSLEAAVLSSIPSHPAARSISPQNFPSISSLLSCSNHSGDLPSPCRQSFSTSNTEDLHWFGLEDRLSDTWGEMQEESRPGTHEGSPESPIMFVSSTPPPRISNAQSNKSVDGLSEAPQSKSWRDSNPPPDCSVQDGIETVPASCDGDRGTTRRENKQGWTGEWNRNDMRDVIESLRFLK